MTPRPVPFPTVSVQHGVAEQLARLSHFALLDLPEVHEISRVADFLIGDVGGAAQARRLWNELHADCHRLWHLISDDWDDRDLDELSFADARRMDPGATAEQELMVRYERTRDRLVADIEDRIGRGRYTAVEMRRVDAEIASSMARHPAGRKLAGSAW